MEAQALRKGGRQFHHPQLHLPRRAARDPVLRMKSKYEYFDRSQLIVQPLSARTNDLQISRWLALGDAAPEYSHPQLPEVAQRITAAARSGASRILMLGAHVLRAGLNRLIIDPLERGALSHIAMNGAGAIHDSHLAAACAAPP